MTRAEPPRLSPQAAACVPELARWLRALADQPHESDQPSLALWCGFITSRLFEAERAAAEEVTEEAVRPRDPMAAGPVREALVLGYVHGWHFGAGRPDGAAPFPRDGEIVEGALRAALSMGDRFPHLAAIARRERIPRSDPEIMVWLRHFLGLGRDAGPPGAPEVPVT